MQSKHDQKPELSEKAAKLVLEATEGDKRVGLVAHRGTQAELMEAGIAIAEMFPDANKRDGRGCERGRKGKFHDDKFWRSWTMIDERDGTFTLRRWVREKPQPLPKHMPATFNPGYFKQWTKGFIKRTVAFALDDETHLFAEEDKQKIAEAINVLVSCVDRAKITRRAVLPAPVLRLVR